MKTIIAKSTPSCLSLIFIMLLSSGIQAQTESQYASGWSEPSGVTWTPAPPSTNPLGSPDGFCVGTSNSGLIEAYFTFPSFSTIDPIVGIEFNVNYGSVNNCTMQLTNGGTLIGATRVLPSTPPAGTCNASVIRTSGGPNDLWGTALTAANFNGGNIGVRLSRVTGLDNPLSLDIESVQMIVYYTGGNSPPDCSGAAIATQIADANCQASISGSDVNGVTDPDGDMLTISVNPTTVTLGNNSVTVMADDGNGATCSIMIDVMVIDQTDPEISCPAHIQVNNDPGQCNAIVDFIVTATDNCDGSPTISCTPGTGSTFAVGTTQVNCTATDDAGNTDNCSFQVTVVDNEDPVIDCSGINPNRTTDDGVCTFTMPGTGFDPTFSDNCSGAVVSNDYNSGSSLAGETFPQGLTPVIWTATDASGNMAQCSITISVVDDEPPVITVDQVPVELWPPNHKYQTILAADCVIEVSDNCDDLTADDVVISSVSSDEPENANGDGNTTNDIVIASDCGSVDLRKERQGNGNGRVYTLHLSVTDEEGNEGTAICTVTIPHSKNGSPAIDDGPAYSENSNCISPRIANSANRPKLLNHYDEHHFSNFYPNPFNASTTLELLMDKSDEIQLVIYDLNGRLIREIYTGQLPAGLHMISWDGTDKSGVKVASGIYICNMESSNSVETRMLIFANN